MRKVKKLLILALVLTLPLSCSTWYKGDRPVSEVPKAEKEQDEFECHNHATLECSKVDALAFGRCCSIHYHKCMFDRGWHKEKRR